MAFVAVVVVAVTVGGGGGRGEAFQSRGDGRGWVGLI